MLNNDLKVLVEKYTSYKNKQQSLLFLKGALAALIALALVIFGRQFFNDDAEKTTPTKIEKNLQESQIEEKQVTNDTSENNTTIMIENTLHQKSEEEKSPKSEVTKKASKSKVNSLKVTTEGSSLEELIKNQKKKKSYSATISIANYHYSRREYKDAITWAIEASKMDKSKARPWLIYANSKLSAGKIDIAKKALNIYLKNYQSKEAQALLKKLNAI